MRASVSADDLGGYSEVAPEQGGSPSLGARYESRPDGLILTHVIAGGAAQAAGLSPDDRLVAIGGERVTAANIDLLVKRMSAEGAELHYFRRDRLAVALLPNIPAADDTCDLWLLPESGLSADVLARRTAWLRSSQKQAG